MTRNDAPLLHNWESCSVHSLSLILNRSIEYHEVRSELGASRVSNATKPPSTLPSLISGVLQLETIGQDNLRVHLWQHV